MANDLISSWMADDLDVVVEASAGVVVATGTGHVQPTNLPLVVTVHMRAEVGKGGSMAKRIMDAALEPSHAVRIFREGTGEELAHAHVSALSPVQHFSGPSSIGPIRVNPDAEWILFPVVLRK